MAFKIFVVDDDPHYARLISYRLGKAEDHDVHVYQSGEEVLEHLDDDPQVVFLDIMMPGLGGIETLRHIRERKPEIPVIMVSAQGVVETAVQAMKLGAYDYVTKGHDDLVKLGAVVKNVRERSAMARELEYLRSEVAGRHHLDGIIGRSEAMEHVYRLISKARIGDLPVAILGESGTGKELVARAIHYNSARKNGPFIVVNCAAIPRDLMESECFGHERGAFTGAHARKIGKFEQADGGTIFLDEVGELDLDLQAKLLRTLQSFEFQRVGGTGTIHVDIRVLSATNRNISEHIAAGRFRQDLYFRLFQFPIHLPPLRERDQDILLLANHFLTEYLEAYPEFEQTGLSVDARRVLVDYEWPGNVRELRSAIGRAVLLAEGAEIEPDHLMLHVHPSESSRAQSGFSPAPLQLAKVATGIPDEPTPAPDAAGDTLTLEQIKRRAVEMAYRKWEGNVDKAAVDLEIGRATMYRLLKKYGMME